MKFYRIALALFIALASLTAVAVGFRFLRYDQPPIPEYFYRFEGSPALTVGDLILVYGTPIAAQYYPDNIDLWFGNGQEADVKPLNFGPDSPVEFLNREEPPTDDSPWLGFIHYR